MGYVKHLFYKCNLIFHQNAAWAGSSLLPLGGLSEQFQVPTLGNKV